MNGIFWILSGGMTGWLTGILLGEKGYGKVVPTGCARGLDIFFGVVGASFGHYLLSWAVIGKGTMLSNHGTAVLGATALVGICRLVSERYFRSPSYKGMSRAAFTEWHDNLTVKELATWRPRPRESSATPTQNRQP